MVQDDPKLPDDGGEISKSQGRGIGKSISGYEIFSLPNGKLVRWSTVSCALALAIKKSFLMKMIVFCCTTMAVVTYMPRSFG
jgi:hypothetical protein